MADFDLAAEVAKAVQEYTDDVAKRVQKAVKECGAGALSDVRADSPKRTSKYKDGWVADVRMRGRTGGSVVVKNTGWYRLTHLLEDGHKTRRKRRGKARAAAFPHIKPAEEKWTQKFEQMCEEACKPK